MKPYTMPKEFQEYVIKCFNEVMAYGAKKHGDMNWMKSDGKKSNHIEMHNSIFHHLADSYAGNTIDQEDNLPTLSKVAVRALMRQYIIENRLRND